MGNDVTKDDLRYLQDTLAEQIDKGFAGVHQRQDVANGRLNKAEIAAGQHDVRLVNLEREIFRRPRAEVKASSSVGRSVTDRDVRIVWLTLAAIVAAVELVLRVGPILLHVVTP